MKNSEERKKCAEGMKEFWETNPEFKEEIKNRMKGNKLRKGAKVSEKTKKKIGIKSKERWQDPEFRKKVFMAKGLI